MVRKARRSIDREISLVTRSLFSETIIFAVEEKENRLQIVLAGLNVADSYVGVAL